MTTDSALGSIALGDHASPSGLHLARVAFVAPVPEFSAELERIGLGATVAFSAPPPDMFALAQSPAATMFPVAVGSARDAGGDLEIQYPPGTAAGDFAVLFIASRGTSGQVSTTAPIAQWFNDQTETTYATGQIFTGLVFDADEISTFAATGTREAGGYIMHVYRRAILGDSDSKVGNTDFVSFETVSVASDDDDVAVFYAGVGEQNTLTSGDLSAGYEVGATYEGDQGANSFNFWSANGNVATASGSYTPPNIDPTWDFAQDHDWVSFDVSLRDYKTQFFGLARYNAPLPVFDVATQVTRVGQASFVVELPTFSAAGYVNRSGREVCVRDGGGNSVAPFAPNSVRMVASANGVKISQVNNRLC